MKKLLLFFIAFLLHTGANAQTPAYNDDIMLQSFGWDEQNLSRNTSEGGLYSFLNTRAGVLKAVGFDMIWMPPPSTSTGGVGYIPTDWTNFTQTSWGTAAQLTKVLNNFDTKGLYAIADIVVNHRGNKTNACDFWPVAPSTVGWGTWAITANDDGNSATGCASRSGASETYQDFGGVRDIDHTNATVKADTKVYLNLLKSMGYKGWRWDVAKGFAPSIFGEYNTASSPYFSVGEYWDGNVNTLKGWIDGTGGKSGAFDFALYYTLSPALKNNSYGALNNGGRMAGLAGQIGYDNKAVTFVDNHDTFTSDADYVSGTNIMKAYAYILTHAGIPCVWTPHYYGGTYSKDGKTRTYTSNELKINELMAVRKAAGLNAWSSVNIVSATGGLYAAYIKTNFGDASPSVAMKMGNGSWDPGLGWTVATSGTDYAVWTKTAVNTPPTIAISPVGGVFGSGTTKTVTLTATDNGTPLANSAIHYTIDGTEPTAMSPTYTGPLSVSSTTTVKAISIDSGSLSSGTMEMKYTFNTLNTFSIYFKPPTTLPAGAVNSWVAPKIHYWGAVPTGAVTDAVWATPVVMSAAPEATAGWYKYTFSNVASINFLFRNGDPTGTLGVTKTADKTGVSAETWYQWDTTDASFAKVVTPSLGINDNVLADKNALNLYPNPVDTFFKINSDVSAVSVTDVNGKVVKEFKGTFDTNASFEVSDLAPGVYFVTAKGDSGTNTLKMIKK